MSLCGDVLHIDLMHTSPFVNKTNHHLLGFVMVVFIHTHKPSKALSVYLSISLLIISVLIKYTTPAFLAYIIIPEYPQEIKISVLYSNYCIICIFCIVRCC